jgi:hypothetical protein
MSCWSVQLRMPNDGYTGADIERLRDSARPIMVRVVVVIHLRTP